MTGYQDLRQLEHEISRRRSICHDTPHNDSGGELSCPSEFDGWTCVASTRAGSIAHFPCPYFILGFDPERFGQRICLDDGSWFRHPDSNKTWSNYTTCVDLDDLKVQTHRL